MFEIKGLDQLQKNLAKAQQAFADMEGELGTVNFDPTDPASIEKAIQDIYQLIDERLGGYAANPIVGPMIGELKEKYRNGLLERAAEARLASK